MQTDSDIARLTKQDLEFLLALYFQFHLESNKLLGKDRTALEKWKCEEEKYQMGEIERLITIECLLVHNFNTLSPTT